MPLLAATRREASTTFMLGLQRGSAGAPLSASCDEAWDEAEMSADMRRDQALMRDSRSGGDNLKLGVWPLTSVLARVYRNAYQTVALMNTTSSTQHFHCACADAPGPVILNRDGHASRARARFTAAKTRAHINTLRLFTPALLGAGPQWQPKGVRNVQTAEVHAAPGPYLHHLRQSHRAATPVHQDAASTL